MLASLSIRDVVLIEQLDLDFSEGLVTLTGETGAGKSILLDALGLAMGARADSGLVRHGASQASVTALFELAPDHPVFDRLRDEDVPVEPGEALILKRLVKADGGSRASINGVAASAALMREIGGMLVEIHGQQDDRGLLNPAGHRALLDLYAGVDRASLQAAWRDWQQAITALEEARAMQEQAARDRDWLDHAVAELQAFAPEPGEEELLATRRAAMQRAAKSVDELDRVRELVEAGDGALSQLRQAARILQRVATGVPELEEALGAVDRALIEGDMIEDRLAAAALALAFSPGDLERDETRLFDLRALARKYRVAPDDLAAHGEALAAQLGALDAGSERIAALATAVEGCRTVYIGLAEKAHAVRVAAAAALDQVVGGELVPLKLDAARFGTVVDRVDEAAWGPDGSDRVEFTIATNPGAPFAPLAKIASGGEMSRFILALKVALATQTGAAVMVFDEIDRGVGGAVASAIGERLHRLSQGRQVLVVTHSPQVAARADHHLKIRKTNNGVVTRTDVESLDPIGRREEIARMLSGATITDAAREQAKALIGPASR